MFSERNCLKNRMETDRKTANSTSSFPVLTYTKMHTQIRHTIGSALGTLRKLCYTCSCYLKYTSLHVPIIPRSCHFDAEIFNQPTNYAHVTHYRIIPLFLGPLVFAVGVKNIQTSYKHLGTKNHFPQRVPIFKQGIIRTRKVVNSMTRCELHSFQKVL